MTITEYTTEKINWTKSQWSKWNRIVRQLEKDGLTRSDAQGAVDCGVINGRYVI